MAGEKFPGRAPFHARETVEEFANCQRVESFLREAQASELLTRLAADLWTIENLHAIKYESLRKSAACLLVAVALLLYLFLLSALGRLRGW